jgi:hypothetical protein
MKFHVISPSAKSGSPSHLTLAPSGVERKICACGDAHAGIARACATHAFAAGGATYNRDAVESIAKSGGLANTERNAAAAIYEYALITTVAPKPKTTAGK